MQKRTRKLTDYIKKSEKPVEIAEDSKQASPVQKSPPQHVTDIVSELIEAAAKRFELQRAPSSTPTQEPRKSERAETPQQKPERAPQLVQPDFVTGQLAEEAFKRIAVKLVTCDKQGRCTDDKRVGEVYRDERGVEWQRGFVNTTRLPIFIDFIVEDATITGRVGKALVIESSRGAMAIVPEDYVCELSARYGVRIQIDKCLGYKTSPWAERSKGKKK